MLSVATPPVPGPGAMCPPALIVTPWASTPDPPSVAPELTVTVLPRTVPLTIRLPPDTVVLPV